MIDTRSMLQLLEDRVLTQANPTIQNDPIMVINPDTKAIMWITSLTVKDGQVVMEVVGDK